jgi:enoyl-CoA hydratase
MSAADTTASADPVLTERRGNVLLITLNRPEVRNAVNAALAAGVAGALEELDGDDTLSVGVLTGAGGFFCAGMDLGRGSATAASPASPSAPPASP